MLQPNFKKKILPNQKVVSFENIYPFEKPNKENPNSADIQEQNNIKFSENQTQVDWQDHNNNSINMAIQQPAKKPQDGLFNHQSIYERLPNEKDFQFQQTQKDTRVQHLTFLNEKNETPYLTNTSFKQKTVKQWDSWLFQDIYFCMNRLTITSLVIGLMTLGVLFFGVGFMASYYIAKPSANLEKAQNVAKQLNWGQMNTQSLNANLSLDRGLSLNAGGGGSSLNTSSLIPRALAPFATNTTLRSGAVIAQNMEENYDEVSSSDEQEMQQQWIAPNLRASNDVEKVQRAAKKNNAKTQLRSSAFAKGVGHENTQQQQATLAQYCLHIAVFDDEMAARKRMNSLFIQGYSAYLARVDRVLGANDEYQTLFLLRIGNFDNLHQAQKTADKFQNTFGQLPTIVALKENS